MLLGKLSLGNFVLDFFEYVVQKLGGMLHRLRRDGRPWMSQVVGLYSLILMEIERLSNRNSFTNDSKCQSKKIQIRINVRN